MNTTTLEQKTTYTTVNGQFVGFVEGNTIYQLTAFGFGQQQKVPIGVVQQTFDELQAITDSYYDKLVELGVITPPKTAEELAAEQQKVIADMYDIIKGLKSEIEELKGNGHQKDSTNTES